MSRRLLVLVVMAFGGSLLAWGALLDGMQPLQQPLLFAGLQIASLTGAVLGLGIMLPRARSGRQRALQALAALVGWRLAYFPVMVFSGHLASIGEWLLARSGLPIFVYPTFLVAAAALHAVAAAAAILVLAPPRPWVRLALLPAFAVAACVSFLEPADLSPLPDTCFTLDAPVPPRRAEGHNPYQEALGAPGYWPNQRVILLAAALTYDTIPHAPWATTVKAVLEGLFDARPHASSHERVCEHYLAYHSAQALIGCRRLSECPVPSTP